MRIAFITFEYPPFMVGGAGVYALNITRELMRVDQQVFVFFPQVENSKNRHNAYLRGVKVKRSLPFKSLQFWISLPKVIEKANIKFDIIHFNGISYWCFRKKLLDVPHVITIHHLVHDAIKINKIAPFSMLSNISNENNLILSLIEKRCINCADKIIAVSNFTKNQIISTYGIPSDKIEVIYNGISTKEYNFSIGEIEKFRKKFNIPQKPIILFVGRVDDPRKGLDVLLNAFKKALEEVDAKLIVVGKGDQTKMRNLAKSLGIIKNVVFTGFVDSQTLKKFYIVCDLYVCPSRLEGFGLTILEAMAAGKPIIASDVGSIPEIIKDAGVLVKPNDPDSLAQAIVDLLINNDKRKEKLKEKALKRVEDFNWNKTAEKVLGVYKKLVEEK